jgi:hypothetical protein
MRYLLQLTFSILDILEASKLGRWEIGGGGDGSRRSVRVAETYLLYVGMAQLNSNTGDVKAGSGRASERASMVWDNGEGTGHDIIRLVTSVKLEIISTSPQAELSRLGSCE